MNTAGPKALAALGAFAAVLALGACTDSGAEQVVTPSGVATATPQPTAPSDAPVTKVTEAGVNEPPALKDGATSIILDVRQTKCEAGPGKVSATGTVTNRATEQRDLVITASWNTPDNSKTFAQSSAVLKAVPAGETRGYQIESNVEAPKDAAIVCTFSAMAGSLK